MSLSPGRVGDSTYSIGALLVFENMVWIGCWVCGCSVFLVGFVILVGHCELQTCESVLQNVGG